MLTVLVLGSGLGCWGSLMAALCALRAFRYPMIGHLDGLGALHFACLGLLSTGALQLGLL